MKDLSQINLDSNRLDEMSNLDKDLTGVDGIFNIYSSSSLVHSIRIKYYNSKLRDIDQPHIVFWFDGNEVKYEFKNLSQNELRVKLSDLISWITLNRRKIIFYSLNGWRMTHREQMKLINSMERVNS